MNNSKTSLARIGLATAGLIATLNAPIVMACAAIGGLTSYKLGKSYGHKKYGARDVGGVMPIALICLGSGTVGTAIGAYTGVNLSESFEKSASSAHSYTSPSSAYEMQASQDLQKNLSRHFVHNFDVK